MNRKSPVTLLIQFMDGQHLVFEPTDGWKVNTERQMLILGGRPPRMEFPLCNIRYYMLEPIPNDPRDSTDCAMVPGCSCRGQLHATSTPRNPSGKD